MYWTCALCKKEFKTWHILKTHREKKIPCDHKCPVCGIQFKDTRNLTNHKNKEHPDYNYGDEIEIEVEVLEPVQQPKEPKEMTYREARRRYMPQHFPLDDYNWEALTQSEEMKASWTKITDLQGGKQMLERVTYERYIIERSENLSEDIHDFTKMRTLCVLNKNENHDIVQQQVVQLLCEVNAQKSTPRLHSLYKSDEKGNVMTYNRISPESDHCQWISHNPNDSHDIVTNHGKRLLMFALQAGIYLLKLGLWMVSGDPALYTHESHPNGDTYVIIVYFDKTIQELRCQRNAKLTLKDFIPIPELDSPALLEKLTHLITLVEQRKQEIISTLKHIQLSKQGVDLYLKFSHTECSETVASNKAN